MSRRASWLDSLLARLPFVRKSGRRPKAALRHLRLAFERFEERALLTGTAYISAMSPSVFENPRSRSA